MGNFKIKNLYYLMFMMLSTLIYGSGGNRNANSIKPVPLDPATIDIRVKKIKSKEETMYIDRANKKIYYFFGNGLLQNNDFIRVTEELNQAKSTSKSISKHNKSVLIEHSVETDKVSKNLEYGASKGDILNRIIVEYKDVPSKLFVEVYSGNKKLRGVAKATTFEDITVGSVPAKFNYGDRQAIIEFTKDSSLMEDFRNQNGSIEIFAYMKGGVSKNLNYTFENITTEGSNIKGILKIQVPSGADGIYIVAYTGATAQDHTFKNLLKVDIKNNITNPAYDYYHWNSGIVDLSGRNGKTTILNDKFEFGQESLNGNMIPYLDVNMGIIEIPSGDIDSNIIKLQNLNFAANEGNLILKNPNGDYVDGRIYFKVINSTAREIVGTEHPVKGYNNDNIPNSTSKVEFARVSPKKAVEVHVRMYDLGENGKTKFVSGKYTYLENISSTRGIEIYDNTFLQSINYKIPQIEILDLANTLKKNLFITKKVINFTKEPGVNISDDIKWVLGRTFVDVKLLNVEMKNFVDKTDKLKNPSISIDSLNGDPDLEIITSSGTRLPVHRYYMTIENGVEDSTYKVDDNGFLIGYSKVTSSVQNQEFLGIQASIIVRLTKADFIKAKKEGVTSFQFKKKNGAPTDITAVFNNMTTPIKQIKIPLQPSEVLTEETQVQNNEVTLNGMIYYPEFAQNKINLVFNPSNNSTGNIAIRSEQENINNVLRDKIGYSVFDMNKGLVVNEYDDSYTVEAEGTITHATGVKMTTAKFSTEGYKSIEFTSENNIKFEIRFWNNTNKIEIAMDKTNANGKSFRNAGVVVLKNSAGEIINKIDFRLFISTINPKAATTRYNNGNLLVKRQDSAFTMDTAWNTKIQEANRNFYENIPVYIVDNTRYNKVFQSFDGDDVYVEPIKGVSKEGLQGKGITLLPATGSENNGTVINNQLHFTRTTPGESTNGLGKAQIKVVVTKDWVENIWPADNSTKQQQMFGGLQLVYGNGKRHIQLDGVSLMVQDGNLDSPVKEEAFLTLPINKFNIGLINANSTTNNVEIVDVNVKPPRILYTITGSKTENIPITETGVTIFKNKSLRTQILATGIEEHYLNPYIRIEDVPTVKERTLIGKYTLKRLGGWPEGIKEENIYSPAYSPIKEAYSGESSLQYINNGDTINTIIKPLKIIRDSLDDPSTTQKLVIDLGTIKLFGLSNEKTDVLKRSSSTLNIAKLPDKVYLVPEIIAKGRTEPTPENKIIAKLSFKPSIDEIEKEQKSLIDEIYNIYLIIDKSEAIKLKPNILYYIKTEFNGNRVSSKNISDDVALYLGLKTDKTNDLGFNEYIYEPVFKLAMKSEMKQDTDVRLKLFKTGENKPLLKSNGTDKLIRMYLDEAKYSIDVVGKENYSQLEMKGLQIPFDYENPQFKNGHLMKVTDLTTGRVFNSTISSQGGFVSVEGSQADVTLGYSNSLTIKEGMKAPNSMGILNLGLMDYHFTDGIMKFRIDHIPLGQSTAVISQNLQIQFPKFQPREWYYNNLEPDSIKTNNNIDVSKVLIFENNRLIFPLGIAGLDKYRDRGITVTKKDSVGVRIEHDPTIELVQSDDPSKKITAKIIQISKNGFEITPKPYIQKEPGILALEVNEPEYDRTKAYKFTSGNITETSNIITNKPIRIGVTNHWQGLVQNITIPPLSLGKLFLYRWRPPLVNITDWKRKDPKLSRSFDLNTHYKFGVEPQNDGTEIPYVDINMGVVSIYKDETANKIFIDNSITSDRKGRILLKNKNGDTIEGRLYLKPGEGSAAKAMYPIKGYDNKDIPGSTISIEFVEGADKFKNANVYLRLYDLPEKDKSLFIEGPIYYINDLFSNSRAISIARKTDTGETILKTSNNMPKVEFVDLRDKLKDKIYMDKRTLNFTKNPGLSIGEDTVWVLGGEYVDIRLAEGTVKHYVDETSKIYKPYISIEDNLSLKTHLNGEDIIISPIYLYPKVGNIKKEDEIIEPSTNRIIGYKRVYPNFYDNNVGEVKVDLYMRLSKEQYLKIKSNRTRIPGDRLNLTKEDGSPADLDLIFNEKYPNKSLKLPLLPYKIIRDSNDINNTVNLKALIYYPEFKDNIVNFVFDPLNNSSGNVAIRGVGNDINGFLATSEGISVFDMPNGIIQTEYNNDSVLTNTLTGVTRVSKTSASFSVEGYESLEFYSANNIKFELRFWNNTNKVELVMDKSKVNNEPYSLINGQVSLVRADGQPLNTINLNLSVTNKTPVNSMTRYKFGNLIMDNTFTMDTVWNTETQVLSKMYQDPTSPVSIISNKIYNNLFKSYSSDDIYVEPVQGISSDGIEGRGITLSTPTSGELLGSVENNKLHLTADGEGRANIQVKVTKYWADNIWPATGVPQQHRILTGLDLVYGNGKRRVPLSIISIQNTRGSLSAITPITSKLTNPADNFSLGLINLLDIKPSENRYPEFTVSDNLKEPSKIIYTYNRGDFDNTTKTIAPLNFRGKSLKRNMLFSKDRYTAGIYLKFKDVPILKDEAILGKYLLNRGRNTSPERTNENTIVIPAYDPIFEGYSNRSSFRPGDRHNIGVKLYRENTDDRSTTQPITQEIGTIYLLGMDKTKVDILKRNSNTLNILKLPDKVILKRFEDGLITKSINAKVSFAVDKEELELRQQEINDVSAKVFLKLDKKEAEKLDANGYYIVETEYNPGRIAAEKVVGNSPFYIGLKTNNTADLGFDEYIYKPIADIAVQSNLTEDKAIRVSLGTDNTKPIAKYEKSSGKGLISMYKDNINYIGINDTNNYDEVTKDRYVNPFDYNREDLSIQHNVVLIDELTKKEVKGSYNGGILLTINTIYGKITMGHSNNTMITTKTPGMINPLEATLVGISDYKFKEGKVRLLMEHKDSSGLKAIYQEGILLKIPPFKPKTWYYNFDNQNKLEPTGEKIMKYITGSYGLFPLGEVGLNQSRDREITIGPDDPKGARIEYTPNIKLQDRDNPSETIDAEIVEIDDNGNILTSSSEHSTQEAKINLAIKIPFSSSYDPMKSYMLVGRDGVNDKIIEKPIRIGRNDHWETLVKNISLKPISLGNITLNLNKDYMRNANCEFSKTGSLSNGIGLSITKEGHFIDNVPTNGTIDIYKYTGSPNSPKGTKLASGVISGGALSRPLYINNSTGNKTNYQLSINKLNTNNINLSLSSWGKDIANDKLYIEIKNSNRITGAYIFGLVYIGTESMLTIDYDNRFLANKDPNIQNSLYLGDILNPNVNSYNNNRLPVE
ncbi:MAG: hypothetical protein ACRCRV_04455, partial [Cetobacterium sp.]